MKIANRKGFTMVELLIVLAIIAILAAVAIPVYSSQLENARKEVDNSNLRAATGLAAQDYILREAGKTGTTGASGQYYAVLTYAQASGNTAAVTSQNMMVYPLRASSGNDTYIDKTTGSITNTNTNSFTISSNGNDGKYTLTGDTKINSRSVEIMKLQQNAGNARFIIQIGNGGVVLNSEVKLNEKNGV